MKNLSAVARCLQNEKGLKELIAQLKSSSASEQMLVLHQCPAWCVLTTTWQKSMVKALELAQRKDAR